MREAQALDPIAFKQKMRQEWNDAAGGWRKWYNIVEGRDTFIRDVTAPFSVSLEGSNGGRARAHLGKGDRGFRPVRGRDRPGANHE